MKLNFLNFNQEQYYLKKIFNSCDRNLKILDLGSGLGRNLDLLKSMGFNNLLGADINPEMVNTVLSKGFECVLVNDLSFEEKKWDIILMSHLIEHFDHQSLQKFIESYINLLTPEGKLVISTPLLNQSFYNDFDHIKPYNPLGLQMVFGSEVEQIQLQSKTTLRLKELYFYRLPWRLQWHSTFYLPNQQRWPHWINRMGRLFYALSLGRLGTKSGWIGCFELT